MSEEDTGEGPSTKVRQSTDSQGSNEQPFDELSNSEDSRSASNTNAEAAPQEEEPKKETIHQKRAKIVNEMRTTEELYVRQLQTLVKNYLLPLRAIVGTEIMPTRNKDELNQIFANVEQLLPINRQMLEYIQERCNNWHDGQMIGDVFLKMAPIFRMYNSYGNNYDTAVEVLDRCMQDPLFSSAIDGIAAKADSLSLENLLITPVQRIPRYNLLLRDLLAKTPEDHPDYRNLVDAMAAFENVTQYLDKNFDELAKAAKFHQMASRKGADKLMQAHRVLKAEGVVALKAVNKINSKNDKGGIKGITKLGRVQQNVRDVKLQIWLFNDVIVTLKTSKSKKTDVASTEYNWPLSLVWLKEEEDDETNDPKFPHAFQLVGPRKTYILKFADQAEKKKWWTDIVEARKSNLNEEIAPDEVRRKGRYDFPKEGGMYDGWWSFGRIHGEGTFKFFNNSYSGQWNYNCKEGIGTFELITGEIYYGEWRGDHPHGYGVFTYTNRDRYEGTWKDGMRHGRGVFYFANGDKYDGEWEKNTPTGDGSYITITGLVYKGAWFGGRPHGFGVMTSPNGRRYEGEFTNGRREGDGRMDYGNGDFYVGQWRDGKRHGFGVFHSAIEGFFEGNWVFDLKEGSGKMQFKNGNIYDGQWKRGLYHGQGTLYCIDGSIDRYEGSWESGMFNGKGLLLYKSGSRYEGQFKDDMLHGNGVYTSANKVTFDGKWVENKRDGKATIVVGPVKFSANCHNGSMVENTKNILVVPDVPAIHLEL